ncbi:futalosine hydrolase [Saccharibacillus sp. JS10]|uniref:futalosine hydrolase n=1 Tax=Saccharibacillus sp. JS10 TaxID=2950552 RepID=UPI00210CA336|nr:futalosine hydrolase [Saccharibacillus sp. JS10]MCQ4086503.1 futalosine hydrolase [Saccharibacillus sp. JS10]
MYQSRTERILVVTAVEAESEVVRSGLNGDDRFVVIAGGVGPAAVAAATAKALAGGSYSRVVSAGIAGGFAESAAIGSLVVASRMVAADLGSDSPDGFISVDELGFGSSIIPAEENLSAALTRALQSAGLQACLAPVVTVSTTTGTQAGAEALAARVPGAAAEGMEGFGVAEAARQFGLPAMELRAISNAVGPRDRSAWKIGDALSALRQASSILPEVFFP